MANNNSGGSGGEGDPPARLSDHLDAYLRSKGKGPDSSSGTYRRNAERELTYFITFLETNDVYTFEDVTPRLLRTYIRDELLDRNLKPKTVHKYYDYVSAFLGWAQREGLVDEHVGIQNASREPLPDLDERAEKRQQTWRTETRQAFLSHLDERAHAAIEADGANAYAPTRNRALAYLLAFSGVRGAEILSTPEDDRRNGANWRDISDELDSVEVLGKSQEWETRAIPPQARPALKRWQSVFDPEPSWPLVPSFHYPSLYGALPEDIGSDGLDGYAEIFDAYREADRRPPALSADGARRLFKRLTEDAEIDVEEDYLQLHGARRGVGRVLALQQGIDAAADQLDNSPEVVREAYSDVLASERAEKTGEAFDEDNS